jgi:urease accessory protein
MRFSVIAPPRVMARDARAMRGDGPFVFAQANRGVGLPEICEAILSAWREVVPCR